MNDSSPKFISIINSLRLKMLLLIALIFVVIFSFVIYFNSKNLNAQLKDFLYEDLSMKNRAYVSEISAIIRDREAVIMAVRDDLERYETRGQMWIHLSAHTAESVFDDPVHGDIYKDAFRKKLYTYYENGQLSKDKISKELKSMLEDINRGQRKNSYGEGMKFFYIGVDSPNEDKVLQGYDEYQDSSLWVPDPRVDVEYNPLIRPWYVAGQKAGRDKVLFTEPYAERRTNEALISGGTLINVEGKKGTLAAGISIKPIMEQIQISNKVDDHLSIFSHGTEKDVIYVKSEPKYIYSSRDKSLGDEFKAYNDEEVIKDPSNRDLMEFYDFCKDSDSGVEEWTINGEKRLIAYETIPNLGWKVMNSVSKEKTLREFAQIKTKNILVSVLGLIVLLLILYVSINKFISPIEQIKEDLLEISKTGDLSKRISVTGKDEIGEISRSINQMLDNTATPVKKLGDKVGLIASGNLDVDIDIVARGDIKELINSFDEMTKQLIVFEKKNKETSPLTGLFGGVSIEEELKDRLKRGEEFTVCMIDVDHFKPFNDRYGYSRGNLIIKHIAKIIERSVKEHGGENDFIGHIGGDDFMIISEVDKYKKVCDAIIRDFDESISDYYDEEDVLAGFIDSKDRSGKNKKYKIMSITISAINSANEDGMDFHEIGEELAKLKSHGKTLNGSNLVTDEG